MDGGVAALVRGSFASTNIWFPDVGGDLFLHLNSGANLGHMIISLCKATFALASRCDQRNQGASVSFTPFNFISMASMEAADVEVIALQAGSITFFSNGLLISSAVAYPLRAFKFAPRTSMGGRDIVEVAAVRQGLFAITEGLLISEILTICSGSGLSEASINVRVIWASA